MSVRSIEEKSSDRLLSLEDAADQLGLTPRYLARAARHGRIPHVKVGKYVRIRQSVISDIMENGLPAGEGEE